MALAGSLLVRLAYALALCLGVEAIARGSLVGAALWPLASPPSLLLTLAGLACAAALIDALAGRRHAGYVILAPALLALAAVHHQKIKHLSEPLYPWDLLFVRQVADLAPRLLNSPYARLWLAAAAAVTLLAIAFAVIHLRPMHGIRRRGTTAVVSAAGLWALAYFVGPAGGWLHGMVGVDRFVWLQGRNYELNGFLLAYSFNINSALVRKPQAYDEASAHALSRTFFAGRRHVGPPLDRPERPNVVIVMSEAFWDPTLLPNVTFSEDPLPTVRALNGAGDARLFSPVFGGGTCNTEFEVLTGFSNAFLPIGSYAYPQYIRNEQPSLPRYFQQIGYRTTAIHPYHRWFWNRGNVYPLLGFSQFASLEDLDKPQMRGPYVSDQEVTRLILNAIEKSDEPSFVFAVTVQNHAPYLKARFGDPEISVSGKRKPHHKEMLEVYAQGIKQSDLALKTLVEGLERLERPTLLLFFGDHLPVLGPKLEVYRDTGFRSATVPEGFVSETLKLRSTPLVVWSNFARPSTDYRVVSAGFIPFLVLRELGHEHPFYTGFLGRLWEQFRVIDRRLLLDAKHQPREGPGLTDDPLLSAYRMIQYDQMFGRRHLEPAAFPSAEGLRVGG